MVNIYIGSCENTQRPFSMDDPNDEQSLDNWELLVSEKDAEMALSELVEKANNEEFSLENSWLRIK